MRTLRFLSVALLGLAWCAPMALAQSEAASEGAPLPAAPSATVGPRIKFNVEFGGEAKFISDGDRWSKFEEHRDIPDNFTINSLDFWIDKPGSRWSLDGYALDAGQLDQRYRLTLEKFGVSRSRFSFDSWPNFISRNATSWWTEDTPGILTVNPSTRLAFQAATVDGTTADTALDGTRIGIINGLLADDARHHTTLQTRRQRFQFNQDFYLTRHWFINAGAIYEWRRGHRPLGMGAYNRSAGVPTTSGGTGGATWVAFANELPEPIDFRNTEIRAAMGFKGEKGMIRFEYIGSWFFNNIKSLVFQNPFELTACTAAAPGFATGVGPVVPGSPPSPCPFAPAPGTAGRWRFDQDELYIAPDNRAHTFAVDGRAKLPAHSFVSALFAYQMRRQDSAFVPYTLSGADFSAFAGSPGADLRSTALLPQSNLGGEVNTMTGSAVLGTRHWQHLLLTAHYHAFNYDNQTPVVPLPGIVDMGSFWTTNFDNTAAADFQVPSSYLKQNVTLEGVWRPSRRFHLRLAPFLETWNRSSRKVGPLLQFSGRSMARTNEFGGDTTVIAQPVHWFNAKATYHYANRELQSPWVPAPNEFAELRSFDQAHRVTNNPTVTLNFGGKGPWLVTANYSYLGQAYDQNFYGLGKYVRGIAGVDVNYAPSDRWGVAAYFNHERVRYHYRQAAKENAIAGVIPPEGFAPSEEWDRETRDRVNSVGFAFSLASDNRKWLFSVNYDLSFALQNIHTFNPGNTPVFPIDSTGRDFPNVHSNFQEVFCDLAYAFRPTWQAGVRYIFSPYELQDFASDIVTPYNHTQSATPVPGSIDPQSNGVRFLLLDSRSDSFDAHMAAFYIRHWF